MQHRVNEPFTVVIPARYASSRLPGKPLVDIGGRPMCLRVYDRACRSGAAEVVLATDDRRIFDVAQQHDVRVLMTSTDHASGTDRIAEVAATLGLPDDRIVVNVQGDEPLVPPELISQAASLLADDAQAEVATLTTAFAADENPQSPNFVKVVTNDRGHALYFSRAVIPYSRDSVDADGKDMRATRTAQLRRHVGIYAYRVSALSRLAAAPVCILESTEMLEQLRCLWLGMCIAVADACVEPARGVDTEDDLRAVRAALAEAD